jgi:hypothetical protein
MRLVYRDKGCAVCLAAGVQVIYKYCEDSNRYEEGHIIDFAYHDLVSQYLCNSLLPLTYSVIVEWDARGFSALVRDPFTDPTNANSRFASSSTQAKKDLRRINSLENGILLCLEHHRDYDNFRFAIHPQVKTTFLLIQSLTFF